MFKQLLFLLCLVQLTSCATSQEFGTLKGTLTSPQGELLSYVNVFLENTSTGTISDELGNYKIENIPAGEYVVVFQNVEIGAPIRDSITIDAGQTIILDKEIELEIREMSLKPIIYIYPEDTMEISVALNYAGQLTTTYPKLEEKWDVTAYPDGTLKDANGRSYYSLYWEGIPTNPLVITEGNVVAKDETIAFLEESLTILGLNEREANEFIIFWLPMLEESAYNVIEFSTEAYENQAQLNITPAPDQVIRVMLLYHGLKTPIELPMQNIQAMKRERSGYTVVEWGGQHAKVLPEN